MKILVTGSSACLAQAVLPLLCAQPDISGITGVDLRPSRYAHPKFRAMTADFRAPQVTALLPAHDALVHLAYVVLRGRMRTDRMRDTNVSGSYTLLRAAGDAGVRRVIHLSSAAVYGSGRSLDEAAPFAPLRDFSYGQHKAELETWLARELPQCVRLRPHVILGPRAQPTLRQILALPVHLRLPDPQPELQCVHEDDVAAAVLASLRSDVCGAFNLAAADPWDLRDVMRRRHAPSVPLPVTAARAALSIAHGACGWGGEPGWLDGLLHTLTLDCSRARRELGWVPRYSGIQTLAATR